MTPEERRARWKKKYERVKSNPDALARRRANERAAKKRRYRDDPKTRAKVIAASRTRYAESWDAPRWRAGRMLASAKKRAKVAGLEFSLTTDDVLWPILFGKCQATGLPFDLSRSRGGHRAHPFAPSIDRVDSSKGYTKNNVQIVCNIHNVAKNEWAESVFNLYIQTYAETLR